MYLYAHYTGPDRRFGARLRPEARTPESPQGSLRTNYQVSDAFKHPVRNNDRDRAQKRPLLDSDHIHKQLVEQAHLPYTQETR
ncbi:uncharacterized protein B0T23DRAFT_314007 [Neurospora hispaniola]|uniref:Uncharacterized protein n=1 Tax=Neurospora hispaniola TaxID=588809 RepID=A0AAJ0MS41_9PEZI|nr:hypothetical protein B0T23DRAFT_314007 [Neurospora hispaniola]